MPTLSALASILRSRNPWPAVKHLQAWCRTTPLLQIRSTLLSAPTQTREPVASAVKDILAGYPRTIWAVPLILYGARTPDQGHVLLAQPSATGDLMALRRATAGPHLQPGNTILANRVQAALLKVPGGPINPPELPPDWAQALFDPAQGTVHVAGGRAFPWPESVEAAMVMQASAQLGGAEFGGTAFLSDQAWAYAKETAGQLRQAVFEGVGR